MLRAAPLVATIGLIASSAASSAEPPKRHYELAVDAVFYSHVDHGNDQSKHIVGLYTRRASFQLRAVVVFENRTLKVANRAALVAGEAVVVDDRLKIVDVRTRQRGPFCPGWDAQNTQGRSIDDYQLAPSAAVAVGAGKLRIDPGLKVKWVVGCGVADFLQRHGLQAGPGVSVRAPTYARFARGLPATLQCVDKAKHDAKHGHGVGYEGEFAVRIRLAPIAPDRLSARVAKLRSMAGDESASSLQQTGLNKGKPCI